MRDDIKEIKICIGSSCHIKGSYDVIEEMKLLIEENNLKNKIELKGSFCLGNCTNGVSVQLWNGIILSLNKENVKRKFNEEILSLL